MSENNIYVSQHKRKKRTFYSILGLISDCIIIPVIIIALFSSFVLYSNQRKNEIKSVFGVSFVAIQSGSMMAGGFNIGDIVIINSVNTDNLRPKSDDYAGDIIAFYYVEDIADENIKKTLITDFDNIPEPTKDSIPNRKDKDEVIKETTRIYFHRVVGVYVDETGTRFFKTKGDSNGSADAYYIREDFVAGKYVNTPIWIRSIFRFCASGPGMIALVVLPLTVLIFMQMLSLLEQISALMIERKVIAGYIKFNDKESINANVGYEMREFDKIYFFDAIKENKQDLKEFLWVYPENVRISKRLSKHLKVVDKAINTYYELGSKEYWNFWKKHFKRKRVLKKIKILYFASLYYKGGRKYEDAVKLAKKDIKKYNI